MFPEVLAVKDKDINDLDDFHEALRNPPYELSFSRSPGSLMRHSRQVWIAADRVSEVAAAHSCQQAFVSRMAV